MTMTTMSTSGRPQRARRIGWTLCATFLIVAAAGTGPAVGTAFAAGHATISTTASPYRLGTVSLVG